MSRKRIVAFYIVTAAIILSIAGCSNDIPDYPTRYQSVEIVTLLNNANPMMFEFYNRKTSIKLCTEQHIDTILPRGQRLMLDFDAALSDTSLRPIPIRVRHLSLISFDSIRYVRHNTIAGLADSQLEIVSHWQTGNYINFQVDACYDGAIRTFSIVADNDTRNNNQVVCYMYNTGDKVSGNNVKRRSYGSFYLGTLCTDGTMPQSIRLYKSTDVDSNDYIDIAIEK